MNNLGPNYLISSTIEAGHLQELEDLFYFNPNQWKLRKSIEAAIECYGTPRISNSQGKLRLILSQIDGAQTLYLYRKAARTELIGVVLYVRERECLKVLFWALKPAFTAQAMAGDSLLLLLLEALKDIGRRIVEIRYITFTFGSREHRLAVGKSGKPQGKTEA